MKGVAHNTGGGFTDNIPRVFPKGLGAVIIRLLASSPCI